MPQAYATNFQTPTPLASAEKENPTARWGFPVINFGLAALLTLLTALAGPRLAADHLAAAGQASGLDFDSSYFLSNIDLRI
jgi:hypothetical protein